MAVLATERPRARVAGADVSVDHFIGGRRVASAETFEDHSPLDWSLLAEVSRGDAETAELAVGAAVDAFPGLGGARRRRPRRAPQAAGRSDRRQRRAHRAGRVPRHGDARGVAAPARDPARRAQLPRLRRAGGGLRGARLGVERHAQRRAAHAERPGGRDHALERALHALDLEDGAGARGGLHRRAQAGRVVAALVLAAGRPRGRGRPAARACSTSSRASARRSARRSSPTRACAACRSRARPRPRATSASPPRATSSRSRPSWAARAR